MSGLFTQNISIYTMKWTLSYRVTYALLIANAMDECIILRDSTEEVCLIHSAVGSYSVRKHDNGSGS